MNDSQLQYTIEGITRDVGEQYAFSSQTAPQRWQAISRDLESRLAGLRRLGHLSGYRVRCDEETNDGVRNGTVVEIAFQTPQRVQYLTIRVTLSELG